MGTTTGDKGGHERGEWQGNWRSHGACRDADPDGLFVRGAEQRRAKIVCAPCPVRAQCLAEALDRRIEFGVWGGMTERERRALLRRRPEVADWWELLVAANREPETAREAGGGSRPGAGQPLTDLPQRR